jgi:hypothetical protein
MYPARRADRASGAIPGLIFFEVLKMAIPSESLPRGKYMGQQVDGPPMRTADRFQRCQLCGGYVDVFDLVWTQDHEGPLPHAAQDGIQ